jgi:50S ribosomal protein L16 3-hydroxylase
MVTSRTPRTRQAAALPAHPDPAVLPLDLPTPLLGGLSPVQFMQRHWHRKPLLVRQAWPGVTPPVDRAGLFELAASDEVESRFVSRIGEGDAQQWTLRRGPLPRRSLPPIKQGGWTVLVQGLDLHVPAAAEMLRRFRFVPQARLDDLMISWAAEGGGVGPHFDSYDVFLIQVAGKRRWRIGQMPDAKLKPDLPVKIIENFHHDEEWVLEPGDMLYLPPGWAHDGDAVEGECMTCSVGFRSPHRSELVRETLLRLADAVEDERDEGTRPVVYRDPGQRATVTPGRIPQALLDFAEGGATAAAEGAGCTLASVGGVPFRAQGAGAFRAGAGVGRGQRSGAGCALVHALRRPPGVPERRVLAGCGTRRLDAAPTGRLSPSDRCTAAPRQPGAARSARPVGGRRLAAGGR